MTKTKLAVGSEEYEQLMSTIKEKINAGGYGTNVTSVDLFVGDHTIQILDNMYNVNDFYKHVQGDTTKLYQKDDYLIIVGDEISLIWAIDKIEDTNITALKLEPKGKNNMTIEKVVGTTFTFQEHGNKHFEEFVGENVDCQATPTRVGQAILMPEPTNPFDANAIAVVVQMTDGKPFRLGYLSKTGLLYTKITAPTLAKLIITAYSEGGDYNDSYQVEVQ